MRKTHHAQTLAALKRYSVGRLGVVRAICLSLSACSQDESLRKEVNRFSLRTIKRWELLVAMGLTQLNVPHICGSRSVEKSRAFGKRPGDFRLATCLS